MTTPPLISLKIVSTAYGGKGVARENGKVYFVEDALEGDEVLAEITEESERYNNATAREVTQASAWRKPSPCSYSHACGGCQWQGVPYEQQLVWKKHFVVGSLERIGKFKELKAEILGSPAQQQYRNRILLRARLQSDGSLVVGYFRRGSRDFVAVNPCLIADTRINRFIESLKDLKIETPSTPLGKEIRFRFEIQELPAKTESEPHLLITIYDPDEATLSANKIAESFRNLSGVLWAGAVRDIASAPFFPFETDLDVHFHTAAGLFQQVNITHNHTLRRLVLAAVESLTPKTILDIYCGSGNISLPLAKRGYHVRGVEFSKRAIQCAAYNCEQNDIKSAKYFSGDTEKFLWRASKAGEQYDLVIADPPREGMYKALIPLKNMKPKHIIYISCDPTTLARDLASLCKSDYRIVDLKALDFFPNTYHIESFVLLERQN